MEPPDICVSAGTRSDLKISGTSARPQYLQDSDHGAPGSNREQRAPGTGKCEKIVADLGLCQDFPLAPHFSKLIGWELETVVATCVVCVSAHLRNFEVRGARGAPVFEATFFSHAQDH